MLKTMVVGLVVLFSLTSGAVQNSNYLKIAKVRVHEITNQQIPGLSTRGSFFAGTQAVGTSLCSSERGLHFMSPEQVGGADEAASGVLNPELEAADKGLDTIINMGKKVWTIVDAGKPVVNLQTDVATAMPAGAGGCWLDLEGWHMPQARTWMFSVENMLGMEVVRFVYRVVTVAGGSYDSKGHYIGYAAIEPVELKVLWGYKFNGQVAVRNVFNLNTRANPVAALTLGLNWSVETILKRTDYSQSFAITGYDTIREL